MKRTTADFAAAPHMGNVASGHEVVNGVQRVMAREGMQRVTTEPAGGVQSSVADMAIWMNFQLGDGTFQNRRVLSAAAMDEMHSPQIAVPTTRAFREARQLKYFAAYGLGWQIFDYRGSTLLWHSGNGDGQTAFLALVPDAKLGVVVLVNSWKISGIFNNAIVSRILDHYLGLTTRDYLAEYRESWTRDAERAVTESRALEASRIAHTKPTLPLASYAGAYRDQLGLDVNVRLEGDTLRLQYGGGATAALTHWQYDTFRARWGERATFVQFGLSPQGTVGELKMELYRDRIVANRLP
jgi:hypothetical protein